MTKQQPSSNNRKDDMIFCERCGEDYSSTYRRCPFCDERPGRRIDEHGYSARNPLHLAVLILSLVIILAAAFIVFTKVAPLLNNRTPESDPGVETPVTPGTPDGTTPSDTQEPVVPDTPAPSVNPAKAIVLSREDITLVPGEFFSLIVSVTPADTDDPIVWSCDRPDLLEVSQDGTVVNKNASGEKVAVTVTATAGNVSAKCIVRCNSSTSTSPSNPGTSTPSTPSTGGGVSISGKTPGKVVGATKGLNVRSGPGSNYEKIASIENGSSVVILENTGSGWYKIDYGNNKIGYASADYIQPK